MSVKRTWTRRNIIIIIAVAVAYGIWFNYLDAAVYCAERNPERTPKFCKTETVPVGEILGDNRLYQPWNVIGHCLPGLFILLMMPRKAELFLAAVLISSAIMDSPLWGVMRLVLDLPLWHMINGENFVETWNLGEWITYYYNPNPFPSYPVWQDSWLGDGLPNAAIIFWSVALRIILAAILVVWQMRQEEQGKEFSLRDIVLLSNYRKRRRQTDKLH